jgi:hypothetical protein
LLFFFQISCSGFDASFALREYHSFRFWAGIWQFDRPILHFLQKWLDIWILAKYPCHRPGLLMSFATSRRIMPLPARRVSVSNNPGNNRPLPQNLWDVIERSG